MQANWRLLGSGNEVQILCIGELSPCLTTHSAICDRADESRVENRRTFDSLPLTLLARTDSTRSRCQIQEHVFERHTLAYIARSSGSGT